jgi:hypothetical protein
MIECFQSQSLNTCKRVGVSGHIPKLLGTWGLNTIILGKSVSQEWKGKERNFVWVETSNNSLKSLGHLVKFGHGKRVWSGWEHRREKSWSVIGVN